MPKILGKNFNWAKPEEPVEKIVMEIKDVPVYMGCVDNSLKPEDDMFADILFGVCPHTGTIQSMNRLPPDKVYLNSHNTCVGKTWEEHNQAFADFMLKEFNENSVICEIGGGDGNIAARCIDYVKEWHCIEPNRPNNYFKHSKLKYHIEGYYPQVQIEAADFVVHSNVLEHFRSPLNFLNNSKAPVQLFSVPNFDTGLVNGNISMLNFEHENGLTKNILDELLDSCGYKHNSIDYKSYVWFYKAEKIGAKRKINSFNYKNSLYLLIQYHNILKKQAVTLEKNISSILKPDNEIFFFGAHIFYTILRSCGLTTEFTGIIDNSYLKINKRLYGTKHIVQHPSLIKNVTNPIVVIPTTPYKEEMVEEMKLLNNSVNIIIEE